MYSKIINHICKYLETFIVIQEALDICWDYATEPRTVIFHFSTFRISYNVFYNSVADADVKH
jgi:hypothetical protein